MPRFLSGTRYLVILPILGLAVAASFFFVLGGIGLFKMLFELLVSIVGDIGNETANTDTTLVTIEVVEFVHTFLVGTVLYITAAGFYQLFIQDIKFPEWLKIDSIEELESNLIGVIVVVLAVNFMSVVFIGETDNLLLYGGGIALPIAALGLFIFLRAWSTKLDEERASSDEVEDWDSISSGDSSSRANTESKESENG
jgi:uncharacterized membrane protein YqhA